MFLQLPPCSVVLIPSAIVTHENIGIESHEERQALTGFTTARIFQWIDSGKRNIKELEENEEEKVQNGIWIWKEGKAWFPHISDFYSW